MAVRKHRLETARNTSIAIKELLNVWMLSTNAFAKAYPQAQADIDVAGKPEEKLNMNKIVKFPRRVENVCVCFHAVVLDVFPPFSSCKGLRELLSLYEKENAQFIQAKNRMTVENLRLEKIELNAAGRFVTK